MSFKVGDRVLFRKKGTLGHLRGALVLKEDNMDIEANPSTVIRDRKSTRLNSSHLKLSRMPSSA